MAKVNRDFIEPEVAISLARNELADFEINSGSSLAGYLPSQEVADVEYEIEKNSNDLITAANWRMFGGNTTSERWGEGEKARGRLMPLSRNFILEEETRLRMRNDSHNAIRLETATLVRRAARAIALQVNLQRANALVNGRVDIFGSGGLRQTVDFGRKAEFNVTAPTLFTDPASDPIAYIEALVDLYELENGFRPAEMLMSTAVRRAIFSNPKVSVMATNNKEATRRATDGEVNALLEMYGLPPIKIIQNNRVKVDNLDTGQTEVRSLLPEDSIIFTAGQGDPREPNSSIYGRTLWGKTLSADTPEFRSASEMGLPGIVAAVIEEGWPSHLEVIADAIVMPVVYSPNYTLKAKVI